jgi:hypothetical protein
MVFEEISFKTGLCIPFKNGLLKPNAYNIR